MTIPLANLADAPLHPMPPDGPRPRALLMDPRTGATLRVIFRDGRIDLLTNSPGWIRQSSAEPAWNPDSTHPSAVLQLNWARFGDLLDAAPKLSRDTPISLLAERFRQALDQAVGQSAHRRANALALTALNWSTRNTHSNAHSILITPRGAVLSLFPNGQIPLPGAQAFARALAPLRTSVPGRPIVPIARLLLPKTKPTSAHTSLELLAHADTLLSEAGMDPHDRAQYVS